MIRWCAYCQKYLGEAEPFDCFQLSHGICKPCQAADRLNNLDEVRVRRVASYFQQVAECLTRDQLSMELLDEGLEQGLHPWDLLIGVLQPALRNMGEKWAHAQATHYDEAKLTASCSRIITLLRSRQAGAEALRQAKRPEVLLVNAEGNRHFLGLRLVEFFLLTQGIATTALEADLSTAEVLEAILAYRPGKVGLSCALPEQIQAAGRTVAAIAALPKGIRPQVYVGGYGIRGHEAALRGWPCRLCSNPADLLDPVPAARHAHGQLSGTYRPRLLWKASARTFRKVMMAR